MGRKDGYVYMMNRWKRADTSKGEMKDFKRVLLRRQDWCGPRLFCVSGETLSLFFFSSLPFRQDAQQAVQAVTGK